MDVELFDTWSVFEWKFVFGGNGLWRFLLPFLHTKPTASSTTGEKKIFSATRGFDSTIEPCCTGFYLFA